MHSGGYYSRPMGTPPKTPSSTRFCPKFSSPPFIQGYFTPPDSRENSPSLGGTSPNPQTQSTSFILPPTPGASPHASPDRAAFAQYAEETYQRVLPAVAASAALQREESFGSLQSELTDDVFRLSGSQLATHGGTFGRIDSHRYRTQEPWSTARPDLRRFKSNASTIVPLPSTVYVPGVGDSIGGVSENEEYSHHGRGEGNRSHFSICDTPLTPAFSLPMSSPFLPLEPAPDTPVTSVPEIPEPTSPGLIGLWNSAQRTERTPRTAIDSGHTYELNVYRSVNPRIPPSRCFTSVSRCLPPPDSQTPTYTSEHSPALPEHYSFGLDPKTPFYTLYAMREDPTDNTYNELSFLRRDPSSGFETSVITLSLEPPSHLEGGDGLITLIYPKEAVLSAMTPTTPIRDDAGRTLRTRGSGEKAREAIQKAYATECCRLSWDADRRRYYLYHPGVADFGDAYLVDIQGDIGFDAVGGATGSIKVCGTAFPPAGTPDLTLRSFP